VIDKDVFVKMLFKNADQIYRSKITYLKGVKFLFKLQSQHWVLCV